MWLRWYRSKAWVKRKVFKRKLAREMRWSLERLIHEVEHS